MCNEKNNELQRGKVSVIIPLYNGEKYIKDTILSCMGQTHSNIEIIIVDDYSHDTGVSIVQELRNNDSRIFLYKNNCNEGFIKTVNKGIKLSCGEFILCLGHDDVLASNHIESMLSSFDESTSLVFCSSHFIDSNGRVIKEGIAPKYKIVNLFLLSTGNKINSCGLIMKKKFVEQVDYYAESKNFSNFAEWDLWIKLASVGMIKYSNQSKSYYRRHSNNITNTFSENETRKLLHQYFKHCRKLAYKLGSFNLLQTIVFVCSYMKFIIFYHLGTVRRKLRGFSSKFLYA